MTNLEILKQKVFTHHDEEFGEWNSPKYWVFIEEYAGLTEIRCINEDGFMCDRNNDTYEIPEDLSDLYVLPEPVELFK